MDATPTHAAAPATPAGSDPSVAQLRHRRELPLLIMGGSLSIVGAIVLIALTTSGIDAPGWLTVAVAAIVAAPVIASFIIRYTFWQTIANGVEVTADQFPEVYALFRDSATRMGLTDANSGMDALPRLFVVNGNGVLNAYATKCQLSRAYVVIYSDLIDIAYEHGDFSTVRFALTHELGHVKCRHVSLWRQMLHPVARVLFLSPTIFRAQEYTADRVASYYAPEGAMGLSVLYAGKRMYRRMDIDAYFDAVEKNQIGFWFRLAAFRSDHPIGFRRMVTLRRVPTEGWDVHGPML